MKTNKRVKTKAGPTYLQQTIRESGTPRPSLAIEYKSTAVLTANPKNARTHSEKQVQQIARSIEAFGFNVPLLVDANLQVVAGHGRLLACKFLGIDKVPVIRLDHLSEHQRRVPREFNPPIVTVRASFSGPVPRSQAGHRAVKV